MPFYDEHTNHTVQKWFEAILILLAGVQNDGGYGGAFWVQYIGNTTLPEPMVAPGFARQGAV